MFALLLLFRVIRQLTGRGDPAARRVGASAGSRPSSARRSLGLRQTGQRLTSITIPPLMGGIADRSA